VQTTRALYKLHFNAYMIKYILFSIFELKLGYEKLEENLLVQDVIIIDKY